jgi:anti-sigma B factor antagonist
VGELNIQVERPSEDLTIMRLSGEFEGYSALDKKEELLKVVSAATSGTLLVDLAGIEYIDSAALGILLEASKTAEKKKLKFGLVDVHDPVKKVLEITKLDKVLKIIG